MLGSLSRLAQWIKPGKDAPGNQEIPSYAVISEGHVRDVVSDTDAGGASPAALEGVSPHILHWVENTLRIAEIAVEGDDGRIRTRSETSLDICATADMIPLAVSAFVEWLRALEAEQIPVEIHCVDGWRVCVLVDEIPLAIRIKERRHRVALLDGFSAKLERWMGGRPRSVLRPSGKLELHVMRLGTSSIAIPFDPADPLSACKDAIRGVHRAAICERNYRATHQQQNGPKITVQPTSHPIQRRRQAMPTTPAPVPRTENPVSETDSKASGAAENTRVPVEDSSRLRMSASLAGLANASRPEEPIARIQIPAGIVARSQQLDASHAGLVRRRRKVRKVTSA